MILYSGKRVASEIVDADYLYRDVPCWTTQINQVLVTRMRINVALIVDERGDSASDEEIGKEL